MSDRAAILAKVYVSAMHAFLKSASGKSEYFNTPKARDSAAKTVREFRELLQEFPECKIPEKPHPPSDLATNTEAGKF